MKWQEDQYPAIKANLQEAGSAATEEDSVAGEEEWQQCSNIQDQAIINPVKLNIKMQECNNNNPGHQGQDQASIMCNVTGARAGDMCPSIAHPILQCSTEVEGERRGQPQRGQGRRGSSRGRGNQSAVNASLVASRTRSSCTAATGAGRYPSSRAPKAGKLAAPRYGQLSALGARSDRLARHEARASTGGNYDGRPTKMRKMYKYNSKEEYEDACRKKRNRARRERRRHAYKRLMAAKKE